MKLERSDSMHRPVTPVTRRISLSVVSPRLSPPPQIVHVEHETDHDNCNFDEKEMKETENQLTRFDSEVESVNEVETEIQPVITGDGFPHEPVIGDLVGTPSLPGAFHSAKHVRRDGKSHISSLASFNHLKIVQVVHGISCSLSCRLYAIRKQRHFDQKEFKKVGTGQGLRHMA